MSRSGLLKICVSRFAFICIANYDLPPRPRDLGRQGAGQGTMRVTMINQCLDYKRDEAHQNVNRRPSNTCFVLPDDVQSKHARKSCRQNVVKHPGG